MTPTRRQSLLLLAIVWVISAAVLISRIDRGWVPHDEGLIGHTAERVLAGELPHRDFDDVYTGGLAYVNAGAMRVFGVNIRSPRIVLIAAFLLCVPVIFYAATRFASPVAAAATTLLAVFWSLPNYTAALPSWYNLIFTVCGVGALLRFVDTERRRWLFVAGVCGGLSFLMKVVGVYYIAGVMLFLVLREQESGEVPLDAAPAAVYPVFVTVGLLAFVLGLGMLIGGGRGVDMPLHFVLPAAALALAVVWNERRVHARRGASAARFAALSRLALPFVLGVAIPVALFLLPYATSHSVGDFVRGVFITPARRLTYATMSPLPWARGLPTLCIVAVLVAPRWLDKRAALILGAGVAIVGAYYVVISASAPSSYRSLFYSTVLLPTVAAVSAAAIVAGLGNRPSVRRQRLMIVAAALAMFALVQFPFAAPIYFCYVTPLLALGALAVVRELELPTPAVPAALAATFIAFAAARMNQGFIYTLGVFYSPYQPLASLQPARGGGVRIPPRVSQEYGRLVEVVRRHAGGDTAYVYAAPDAPEVYFLTGLRNPTRTMYDFFDDSVSRTTRLIGALHEHDVRVVAINTNPEFSPKVDGELRQVLEREYPKAEEVGIFEVRWRE